MCTPSAAICIGPGTCTALACKARQHTATQALKAKLTNPEAAAAARLSKKLVTIQTNVDLPPLRFPMNYLVLAPPTAVTRAAVQAAFKELEFAKHEKRLFQIWENMQQTSQTLQAGDGPVWHAAVRKASELVQS